jgi:hypothetical protein
VVAEAERFMTSVSAIVQPGDPTFRAIKSFIENPRAAKSD